MTTDLLSPAPVAQAASTGGRVSWVLWPFMNWLLPIGLCLHGLFVQGGAAALVLLLISPLFTPAAGLLGALPRSILRREGAKATPAPLVWLLVLHWWSWIGVAVALPRDSLLDAHPSLLQALVGELLPGYFSTGVLVGSILTGIASWLTVLMLTPPSPSTRVRWGGWGKLAGLAVVLAPALLLLAGLTGIGITQLQTDAAGERPAQVAVRSGAEQIEHAQQRYDAAQHLVSELRGLAAPNRWEADAAGIESSVDDGRSLDSYRLSVDFSHPATADLVIDRDGFLSTLESAGWTVTRGDEAPLRIDAHDGQGAMLEMWQSGDGPLRITLITGRWWQSADKPVTSQFSNPRAGLGGGYAADDWPKLR